MARAFVAAFHIVFVKYICLHMYCGKQNIPILFLFLFLLLLLLLLLHTQLSKRSIYRAYSQLRLPLSRIGAVPSREQGLQ